MKTKSFTLIELLVVIVIIGILAGVIMISTSSSINKANIAKSKVFEESVTNNLSANMVSRWKFDQVNYPAANQTPDAWGNNTGTLNGSAGAQNLPQLQSASQCVTDGCLKFDGSDDYVSIATSNLSATQSKVISLWFKLNANGIDDAASLPLLTIDYFRIYVRASNNVIQSRYDYSSAIVAQHTLGAGDRSWHHAIGVYYKENSLNYVKIYIDGVLRHSTSNANDPTNNYSTDFGMGKISLGFFNGLIDDVRIYNATLSSFQIKQDYIAGLNSLLNNGTMSKDEHNERINALAYEK